MKINENYVGNISTIIKVLILTFVPAAFLEHVDANTLSIVLTGIIMFVFSIIDAKYSNNFEVLGNEEQPLDEIAEEGV